MTGSMDNSEFCFPSTLNIEALIIGKQKSLFPLETVINRTVHLIPSRTGGQSYHVRCVDAFVDHEMRVNLSLST